MTLYKIKLELELNPGPDKVYTVTSPDVPGLITEGSTPEEILHNAQEALECLLEGWKKYNMPLPPALQPDRSFEPTRFDVLVAA